MLAAQAQHVIAKLPAVEVVPRPEREAAADDVTPRPFVLVEGTDPHRLPGQRLDVPNVFARPVPERRQQRRRREHSLVRAHQARRHLAFGAFEDDLQRAAGFRTGGPHGCGTEGDGAGVTRQYKGAVQDTGALGAGIAGAADADDRLGDARKAFAFPVCQCAGAEIEVG